MTSFQLLMIIPQVWKRSVKYSWHRYHSKNGTKWTGIPVSLTVASISLKVYMWPYLHILWLFSKFEKDWSSIHGAGIIQKMVPSQPSFCFLSILFQFRLKCADDNFYTFYDYSASFKNIHQVFKAQVLFKKCYQMGWNSGFSQYCFNIA